MYNALEPVNWGGERTISLKKKIMRILLPKPIRKTGCWRRVKLETRNWGGILQIFNTMGSSLRLTNAGRSYKMDDVQAIENRVSGSRNLIKPVEGSNHALNMSKA